MYLRILLFLFNFVFSLSCIASAEKVFRLHLNSEPVSTKPSEQKNSAAGYMMSQVVAPLMKFQNGKLTGDLAEWCKFVKPKEVHCLIKKSSRWSDGTHIRATDIALSWQRFLSEKAFKADLLFSVKNARSIFKGEKPSHDLGVSSVAEYVLEIQLEREDSEFIYNLTSPLLAPVDPENKKFSGPYVISEWQKQKVIKLKSNPHYWNKTPRPDVEFLFIQEDSVALSLYKKGELSFLRRLPAIYIPEFKGTPQYFEIDQFRFDYIGFGSSVKNKKLREALIHSLDYLELQKLLLSTKPPGCPGIPSKYYVSDHCIKFDLPKAKKLWAEIPEADKKSLLIVYSKQGGENHKLTMEWAQSQWLKHLNAKVDVQASENRIFMERIKTNAPPLFRKGVAPERPTCLSALETFAKDSPENYIQFSNSEFETLLGKMQKISDQKQKRKLCDQALNLLMKETSIIPTGLWFFSVLANPQWQGWKLNELNQLDLSSLKLTVSK